jgi:hypothetical protein
MPLLLHPFHLPLLSSWPNAPKKKECKESIVKTYKNRSRTTHKSNSHVSKAFIFRLFVSFTFFFSTLALPHELYINEHPHLTLLHHMEQIYQKKKHRHTSTHREDYTHKKRHKHKHRQPYE